MCNTAQLQHTRKQLRQPSDHNQMDALCTRTPKYLKGKNEEVCDQKNKSKIDLRSSRKSPAAVVDALSHCTVVQTTGRLEEPKSQE